VNSLSNSAIHPEKQPCLTAAAVGAISAAAAEKRGPDLLQLRTARQAENASDFSASYRRAGCFAAHSLRNSLLFIP